VLSGPLGRLIKPSSRRRAAESRGKGVEKGWLNTKREMAFVKVMQDGDIDGCVLMGGPPTKAEAKVIRSRRTIPKRGTLSDEHRARLAATGGRFQSRAQVETLLSTQAGSQAAINGLLGRRKPPPPIETPIYLTIL
jgi:hypothetical protein